MKKKVLLLAPALVLGTGLVIGGSTFALFSANTTNSNNTFTAGTLHLTEGNETAFTGTIGNLAPGDSGSQTFTLQNTGSLQLKYTMAEALTSGNGTLVLGDMNKDINFTVKYSLVDPNASGFTASDWVTETPGSDPVVLDPTQTAWYHVDYNLPLAADASYQGGSSRFQLLFNAQQTRNNTILSNYAPATPTSFDWQDVSTTGNYIQGSFADDNSFPIQLPFSVNFYGQSFNQLWASSNGLISFNGPNSQYNNASMSDNYWTPNNSIAVYWDDLINGSMYYQYQINQNAPDPYVVIQWSNSQHYWGTPSGITFEAKIYHSGKIQLQYLSTSFGDSSYDNGASATVGIRKDSSNNQTYSFNQADINGGTAIEFDPQQ